MAGTRCWLAVVVLLGCSGGSGTSTTPPAPSAVGGPAQTTTVTVNGPGGASVIVPPGASATPVSIAITESPSGAPAFDSSSSAVSSVFAVTPHGASFDIPVTVRVPFDATKVPDETLLTAFQAEEGGQWREISSFVVDEDAHAIEVEVTSFSYFMIATAPVVQGPGITITPLGTSFTQSTSGDWTDTGPAAPTPTLVPVSVSATGHPACPTGSSPWIRMTMVVHGTGTQRAWLAYTPRGAGWAATATEMDLPLLVAPGFVNQLASEGGTTASVRYTARLICYDPTQLVHGPAFQSNAISTSLRITYGWKLGEAGGPADVTVVPGTRAQFHASILGGPVGSESLQYTVDWQRSDDQGQTWNTADDFIAYQMQMPLDPHLWSDTGEHTGFLVRESNFTSPPVQSQDNGALFQARACFTLPSTWEQSAITPTDCVVSAPAKLTVSGNAVGPGAPTITQQPQAVVVTAPSPATFSVTASGTPLSYQWLRNGVSIPGATSATYATPATTVADSGTTFSVVVWNPGGAVVSDGAELTVTAASTPFQVVQVNPPVGAEPVEASTVSTVTATFSASIDCAHLPASSFLVMEGASSLPGTIGCSGSTLTFTPSLPSLPTNTTLNVLLDAGIGDGAGHTLGAAYTWSFGVAPWTRQIGSPGYDEARAVRVDTHGNVFAVGYTNGGIDGNSLTGTSDLFAVKYAPSGAQLWARELGTAGTFTYGLSAAVDSSGNLYVGGECGGGLDGNTSSGSSDIVLVKYAPDGTKLWTHQYGTPADDHLGGVAIDADDHLYLSGWTQGSFGGMSTAGAEDIVVFRLDTEGNVQWIRDTGTPGTDEPTSIAVDGTGNVLVAGYTTGTLAGPGNAGQFDMFVAKFDPSGTYLWARQLGTPLIDSAAAVAADADGNVYVAGYTYSSFDGHQSQGSIDGFVVKYDASGAKQWSSLLGTPGDDFGLGITVDAAGIPYVVGRTSGALDGGSNTSATQYFIARLDPASGGLTWVHQEGAIQHGFDTAESVVTDAAGNVFASGFTNGGMDGNTNAGNYDAFVVKLETSGRKR